MVVAGAPGAAWAQQRAGIVVYSPAGAPIAAPTVAAELSKAVATGASVVAKPFVVARARLRAGAVPRGRLVAFRRAHELMTEGWRAYLGVEVQFAAARLAAARATASKLLDLPGGLEMFAEVSLRLGVVRQHLKQADQAAALFRLAATLRPSRAVTIAEFAPDMVAAYRKAIAAKPPQVSVRVRVRTAGRRRVRAVRLEVDGKAVPATATSVRVTAGQHVVVARANGFRDRGEVFAVAASTDRVELVLDSDPATTAVLAGRASLKVGTGEAAAATAVEGVVRYAELDTLVLVASVWRRGSPALLGQACAGGPARCTRVVELRFPSRAGVAAAARELWRLLSAALSQARFPPTLLVDARMTDPDRGKKPDGHHHNGKRAWWRSRWLWVGAGAVATAVGAAVLLSRDTQVSPVFEVHPCDFGGCQ